MSTPPSQVKSSLTDLHPVCGIGDKAYGGGIQGHLEVLYGDMLIKISGVTDVSDGSGEADHQPAARQAVTDPASATPVLRILPVGPWAIWARNSTWRGYLYAATRSLT